MVSPGLSWKRKAPLTRREFKDGKLHNTLVSWSDQVRKVARELDVPLVDLNADSARAVEKFGPVDSMRLAQVPPSDEERAAAEKGTTLHPRPAPPRPPSSGDKKPGPRGHATLKFDYTHVGPQGAELFAKIVSYDLAVAVPALARQLPP